MRVGIQVTCTHCNRTKQPHGRSAPQGASYCSDECKGYQDEPRPGCLWWGETSADFGYPHCEHATKEITEDA